MNSHRVVSRLRSAGLGAALAVLAGIAAPPALAQSESVQDMIKQLQGSGGGGGGGRTRGMRNLTVEPGLPSGQDASPAPASGSSYGAPAEPRPSLSLLIQFDFNSATVRAESLPAIDRLTRAIRSPELAHARFAIEGHTDAQGRADYNLKLSELRAQKVKEILVQGGVDPTRLLSVGKGSTDPANTFDPRAPENRRVRVVNLD